MTIGQVLVYVWNIAGDLDNKLFLFQIVENCWYKLFFAAEDTCLTKAFQSQ